MLDAHWFVLVDELASAGCRYHGLTPGDADECRSYIRERFAQSGDRIVSAHEGRSSIETYLRVVIARMIRDWQRDAWGHWRPSAEAVRLGPVAVELDRCLTRDGRSFDSAAAELATRFGSRASREELEQLRKRVPDRAPRKQVALEALQDRAAAESADEALTARESAEVARRLGPLICRLLRALDPVDRLVILLVFREGLSVRAVARATGLEHKKVGRRLSRTLDRLKEAISGCGVDRHGVLLLLERGLDGDATWLEEIVEQGWDKSLSRPSS